jgi:hypothetical protein
MRAKLRNAWADPDHARALASLKALAAQLEKVHPDAAGSLREGMQETLTLTRLGVTGALRRTLSSTTPIESMFDTVRTTQQRQALARRGHATAVDRRQDGRGARLRHRAGDLGSTDRARRHARGPRTQRRGHPGRGNLGSLIEQCGHTPDTDGSET